MIEINLYVLAIIFRAVYTQYCPGPEAKKQSSEVDNKKKDTYLLHDLLLVHLTYHLHITHINKVLSHPSGSI